VEKAQFVNFIVTILKKSGFKVYKNFKTFQHVIDIYAVLPSIMGDFTVAIACKNYDKEWKVGLDVVKEMEMVGRVLKVSKVVVATTSHFSPQAKNYASEKKIKLLDRDHIVILAKKISKGYDPHNGMKNSYYQNEENKAETIPDTDEKEDIKINSKSRDYHGENKKKVDLKKREIISPKTQNKGKISIFKANTNDNSKVNSNSGILNQSPRKQAKEPILPKIKKVVNTPIVLIVLVVTISYLISFILHTIANVPIGVQGIVKIFSSFILSYGLALIMTRDKTVVLLKGSLVFFISLLITILMIIFI